LYQFLAYHTYPEGTSLQKRISGCHKEKGNLAKKGKGITYFYVGLGFQGVIAQIRQSFNEIGFGGVSKSKSGDFWRF
jgi:hypothetical protein